MQPDTASLGNAIGDETQFVTFLLKDEEFGFDIMSVQEIIRVPQLARVPKTPAYVEGIANLRGSVLPVIDMRARFGLERASDTDRTRVLVIDVGGMKTGVRVDRVKQVTRVQRRQIEPPPAAIRSSSADYLQGVIKLDNGKRIIMALDAPRVCRQTASRTAEAGEGGAAMSLAESGKSEQMDVQQMVTFRIAKEEFGFPMENVREILRVSTPKQVPDAPDYILGVLTVRGQVLPILDLRKLLRQPTFSQELATRCGELRERYARWIESLRGGANVGTSVAEDLRGWASGFTSSSQLLSECVTRVRTSNERVIRILKESGAAEAIEPAVETLAAFEEFARNIDGNIAEDQRIVVVDANGHPLGLVVDHVNEVLNVPRKLIDAPPEMLRAGALELAGITRLDDGERLIMLLDVTRLIEGDTLQRIAERDDESAEETAVESSAGDDLGGEAQLVTFVLGTEEYGIPIGQVQEIDRVSKITRIPKAPPFVEGITNLRGEVVPVIDTRKRFDLPEKATDDRTRIIIVDLNGVKTGLIVDSVREVLTIPKRSIADPPASLSGGIDQQFLSGIGRVDEGRRMLILLNVERILSRTEQQDLAGFAGGSER